MLAPLSRQANHYPHFFILGKGSIQGNVSPWFSRVAFSRVFDIFDPNRSLLPLVISVISIYYRDVGND
jgi:hypothetical protein